MSKEFKRLRILFVTSDKYPPFRPAARAIYGDVLGKRGYEIDWLMQADERRSEETSSWKRARVLEYGNGKAYIGGTDPGASRWSRLVKHARDIANDLRMYSLTARNHYDLIQVKDKYLSALMAIVVARLHGIPFFYWIAFPHGEASTYEAEQSIARYPWFYRLRGWSLRLLLYKVILPASEHVFVQSEKMKDDFAEQGVSREKMTPVPSSVNLADIPYSNERMHKQGEAEKKSANIVYLGTLNSMRGLDFIIRVFEVVCQSVPHSTLYLVGEGDSTQDEDLLKRAARDCGVESSVKFTGHLPMSEAWEYVRLADVCLSPYFPTPILRSTSPTKLIEYMAMGRAVVANDHPEQKLVIRESGAGICVPWEEKAFADAIVKVINRPELAAKMGRKGREYVKLNRTNEILADVVERQYGQYFNEHDNDNPIFVRQKGETL